MKAFLLAAGLGTRLRPLTDSVPKCLVPICGKPLLQWWTELFANHGVSEVLINTHYIPEPVREYIEINNKSESGVKYYESYEQELVGSGGTVRNNRDFVKNEDSFLIAYADNLTNTDLSSLIDFHKKNEGVLTMALFHTNNPSGCGIATLGENNKIIDFVEKPEKPSSNLANAGIYVADRCIYDLMPEEVFIDFGKDILPKLINNIYGWEDDDYLIDVGTMENYKLAQKQWAEILAQK